MIDAIHVSPGVQGETQMALTAKAEATVEPQTEAEIEAECVAILEDFRAFLDDPVALVERAGQLLRDGTAEAR